jgi:hypothetical protein
MRSAEYGVNTKKNLTGQIGKRGIGLSPFLLGKEKN